MPSGVFLPKTKKVPVFADAFLACSLLPGQNRPSEYLNLILGEFIH
jgi:hypothetical protein